MTKISISVPVYNAEAHLRRCLDSLVNQTLRDIEIIVVNDGSTDCSEEICREYAEKDTRIVLISKNNGGSSSARQAALEASTGKFFCACDADDWVEPTMYEQLYNTAMETKADIVMCDYWSEYPNGKRTSHNYSMDLASRSDLLGDALNGLLPCQVWNKMFRRELFEKNGLSWEPGINLGEDFLIMLKILQRPVTMAHLPVPLYHYRRDMGSASYTNNITMNTFRQSLWIRHWVVAHLDTRKYANGIFRMWVSLAFTGLRVAQGMDKQYYKNEVMRNIPLTGFFKYSYPRMKGGLILLTKIFGYNFGKWLFRIGYKKVYR